MKKKTNLKTFPTVRTKMLAAIYWHLLSTGQNDLPLPSTNFYFFVLLYFLNHCLSMTDRVGSVFELFLKNWILELLLLLLLVLFFVVMASGICSCQVDMLQVSKCANMTYEGTSSQSFTWKWKTITVHCKFMLHECFVCAPNIALRHTCQNVCEY